MIDYVCVQVSLVLVFNTTGLLNVQVLPARVLYSCINQRTRKLGCEIRVHVRPDSTGSIKPVAAPFNPCPAGEGECKPCVTGREYF